MAEPAKWQGRWIIRQAKMHSAYTDQGVPRANQFIERNPLVWLCKATSDWELPGSPLYTPIHLMHD
jgi:hypothetical protein